MSTTRFDSIVHLMSAVVVVVVAFDLGVADLSSSFATSRTESRPVVAVSFETTHSDRRTAIVAAVVYSTNDSISRASILDDTDDYYSQALDETFAAESTTTTPIVVLVVVLVGLDRS